MSISAIFILIGLVILGISFFQYHNIKEGRIEPSQKQKNLKLSDNLRTIGFILVVVGLISMVF